MTTGKLAVSVGVLHSWISRGQVHVVMTVGGTPVEVESYPIDDLVGAPTR